LDASLQIGEMNQQVERCCNDRTRPNGYLDHWSSGGGGTGKDIAAKRYETSSHSPLLVPGAQLPSPRVSRFKRRVQGPERKTALARDGQLIFFSTGVDNQDLVINQYSVLPMTDAIEQFKVQSSTLFLPSLGEAGEHKSMSC